MLASTARAAWRELEAVNAVTYLSPECRDANKNVGLRGFWMGYFASRAAPMGAVSAGVVTATFFNFHPAMVPVRCRRDPAPRSDADRATERLESRGWSTTDWQEAVGRLCHRGLVGPAGEPTEAGRRLRRHIEERTDELAVQPYAGLGDDVDELLLGLRHLATPIVSADEIPFPNPMGLPRPRQGRV